MKKMKQEAMALNYGNLSNMALTGRPVVESELYAVFRSFVDRYPPAKYSVATYAPYCV